MHDQKTIDRFKAFIAVGLPDDCWPFGGCKSKGGYGRFSVNGETTNAHRVAWEIENKTEVPNGMLVRHRCDNRPCCNPGHLIPGTYADNTADAIERNRFPSRVKSHCKYGHEFTPENTVWKGEGVKFKTCRICKNSHARKKKRTRPAQDRNKSKMKKAFIAGFGSKENGSTLTAEQLFENWYRFGQ